MPTSRSFFGARLLPKALVGITIIVSTTDWIHRIGLLRLRLFVVMEFNFLYVNCEVPLLPSPVGF